MFQGKTNFKDYKPQSAAFRTFLSRARLHREDGRDSLKAFSQAAGPFPVLDYDFMENTLRNKGLYI